MIIHIDTFKIKIDIIHNILLHKLLDNYLHRYSSESKHDKIKLHEENAITTIIF